MRMFNPPHPGSVLQDYLGPVTVATTISSQSLTSSFSVIFTKFEDKVEEFDRVLQCIRSRLSWK